MSKNFDHVLCDSFINVNNGMVISKKSMEAAHNFLMGRMDSLFRRMKGLHYGKPRRNALEDELFMWEDIDREIIDVLLLGHCDEWKPVI